jgi:hypothetical protein
LAPVVLVIVGVRSAGVVVLLIVLPATYMLFLIGAAVAQGRRRR